MFYLLIGLLIEANQDLYNTLVSRNRNASYLNACVSITTLPEEVDFVNAGGIGGIKSM